MTLEEAIVHCKEVAERQEQRANDMREHRDEQVFDSYIAEATEVHCLECAADHRQLAEWLRELQEAKRLLKLALEDMNSNNICYDINACNVCTESQKCPCDTFKWRYTDEAEKLLGERI